MFCFELANEHSLCTVFRIDLFSFFHVVMMIFIQLFVRFRLDYSWQNIDYLRYFDRLSLFSSFYLLFINQELVDWQVNESKGRIYDISSISHTYFLISCWSVQYTRSQFQEKRCGLVDGLRLFLEFTAISLFMGSYSRGKRMRHLKIR
jgi:hypothetical protein